MTRVTVCQIDGGRRDEDWQALCRHARERGSDLVVLPELPFSPWLAAREHADPAAWQACVADHDRWITRLGELGAPTVVGSRPTVGDAADAARFNMGFVWTPRHGAVPAHAKTFLPDEKGYWEASWYDRGPVRFDAMTTPAGRLGFLICTELWFLERARSYGRAGVTLLVTPRASPAETLDKWVAGGRTAAVCSGAYGLSSNHAGSAEGVDGVDGIEMGGGGWVIAPDGDVLALTTRDEPFVTVDIDLAVAEAAKSTYPRYVDDAPLA